MQLFRNLAGNIFFKIILAFVALTFVLFGISEFIIGSPNSWVAKIGGNTISYNSFSQALKNDSELILSSNNSEEASKYLNSVQFKSDVLRRLINKKIIEKLRNDYGIKPSRELILKNIAKDPSFKNKEGKFDHALFQKFLSRYGLNEEKYVNEVANEISSTMILQTMSLVAPVDYESILDIENFKAEKRRADIITISTKSVKNIPNPNQEQIKKFFQDNINDYSIPEMRQVSYLKISKKNFAKDFKISNADIRAEYEKNRNLYRSPETRDFYHIIFDDTSSGRAFLKGLKTAKDNGENIKSAFARLAKEKQKKKLKEITLKNISKQDLIPELLDKAFSLKTGQHSYLLKSPLGFHVFLLNKINPEKTLPFAKVKASIKNNMMKGREEKIFAKKIAEIDDLLLTSNSLQEVAKKFKLKTSKSPVTIDQYGKDPKGKEIKKIKNFIGFAENAFALQEGQSSKIFYTNSSGDFYAIKLEKIIKAHKEDLAKIKSKVKRDFINKEKVTALRSLVQEIADKVKENPKKAYRIAAKYGAKFKRNQTFSRNINVNFKGRNVSYQTPFLESLFDIKLGESTPAVANNEGEFKIAILRKIIPQSINSTQFEQAKQDAKSNFKKELMQEYDKILSAQNPVEVNEKFFEQNN